MNKKLLETFISKYHLGGGVDQATWWVKDDKVAVNAISEDHAIVASVSTDQIDLPAGRYDIYSTSQLRSMLSVLGDDIDITINRRPDNTPVGFLFRDNNVKAKFALADPGAIENIKDSLPVPDVVASVKIDADFAATFGKAIGAIKDQVFTVRCDGTVVRFTVGHSDNNQHSITFDVPPIDTGIVADVSFSSEYFHEILRVNKGQDGTIELNNDGMLVTKYEHDGFKIRYTLLEVQS